MSRPGDATLYLGIAETSDPTHRRLTLRERGPSVLVASLAVLAMAGAYWVMLVVTP